MNPWNPGVLLIYFVFLFTFLQIQDQDNWNNVRNLISSTLKMAAGLAYSCGYISKEAYFKYSLSGEPWHHQQRLMLICHLLQDSGTLYNWKYLKPHFLWVFSKVGICFILVFMIYICPFGTRKIYLQVLTMRHRSFLHQRDALILVACFCFFFFLIRDGFFLYYYSG